MRSKRGQAAFEYLFTYGWAILAAIIAIGALSYFGFISPSSLLPNKCSFGKQMECVESRLTGYSDGTVQVDIRIRNNFGKEITITNMGVVEIPPESKALYDQIVPVVIASGNVSETGFKIDSNIFNQYKKSPGEKLGVNVMITFRRSDLTGVPVDDIPLHTITGYVYNTISE